MNTINFILNDTATIKIDSNIEIEKLTCCDSVTTILLKNDQSYLLSTNALHDNMYILKNALKKALKNEHQLHPSIIEDIGYLYNQELQFKPGLVYNDTDSWVGLKNLLWNDELATWLYNDVKGNIILHITPLYPGNWTDIQFDEKANEKAYAEWIAHYQPLWTTMLSQTTAQAWLDFAEKIFDRLNYTEGYCD